MHAFDDEELLARLLNPADADGPGDLATDGDGSRERLAELGALVSKARSASVSPRAEQTEARLCELTEKILARTTREDLSWRGDLSVYGRFLRRRLAGSGWLQVAAASLLVHLIALPALAIYVFVSSQPAPEIGFIPWDEYYPAGFPEQLDDQPVPELEAPDQGDDLEGIPGQSSPEDGNGRTPR